MSNDIKVESGEKRQFSTGASKQASAGKGTPSLVPGDAILDIAKHFENGAAVHGARNWEKGIPLSVWLDSLERHLQQEKMGLIDEPHARALAWNAIVYLATKLRIEAGLLPSELADMPVYEVQDDYNAAEVDKPHVFQPGEIVKIKLVDCAGKYTRELVEAANGHGTFVRLEGSGYMVTIGGRDRWYYKDEIFPKEVR